MSKEVLLSYLEEGATCHGGQHRHNYMLVFVVGVFIKGYWCVSEKGIPLR